MAAVKATKEQLDLIKEIAEAKPKVYSAYVKRWEHQGKKQLTRAQCDQVIKALGARPTKPAVLHISLDGKGKPEEVSTGQPKRVSPEVLEQRQKLKVYLDTLKPKKNFRNLL